MENTNYKNVVLVGSTGHLGKHVLSALLADKAFHVTLLTRTKSYATFPLHVKVVTVNYSDYTALVAALQGQEVVISVVGGTPSATSSDTILIKAALEAGVKWFIPSEFGIDTSSPLVVNNPVLAPKIAVNKMLTENESRIAHTLISTGVFLDSGFDNGFLGFDLAHHTATLYDDGNQLISGTILPHIAQAVVAILHHPALAKNKRIFIADATFNQQQALLLLEKHTGIQWTTTQVITDSLARKSDEYFAKGDTMNGVISSLLTVVFSEANNFENKTSNEVLQLKTASLEDVIKEAVERNKAAN